MEKGLPRDMCTFEIFHRMLLNWIIELTNVCINDILGVLDLEFKFLLFVKTFILYLEFIILES